MTSVGTPNCSMKYDIYVLQLTTVIKWYGVKGSNLFGSNTMVFFSFFPLGMHKIISMVL